MMTTRVALITAAGQGMGAAIARELAANGYAIVLMSPSGSAEKLTETLGGVGVTGSVLEPTDLQRLVDAAMSTYDRIDVVVNNTGHPPKGELLDISDDDWHLGMDMVLMNVVRMSRLVTPILQRQGGGAFCNISTYAAFEPDLAFPVSCALRAALGSFAKLYADRYARDNIRMNNLLPGFIDSYPVSEENLNQIPMGRYGTVEEVAQTVRFLLSDAAGYLTGQNIRMDGGLTRSI
ncbi:MAG: SDR family oxidoreductase [Anaerolineae bacterium]|nr:SDR family oxidoreductase [Anaerolineae bacterium]